MSDKYEEIDSVQAANAEIIISNTTSKGNSQHLVLAPRKSYYDAEAELERLYIPKFSSIEFSDVGQVEELIATLIEACRLVFKTEPRRLIFEADEAPINSPSLEPKANAQEAKGGVPVGVVDHQWFKKNLSSQLYQALFLTYGLFNCDDFVNMPVIQVRRLRNVFETHVTEFLRVQRTMRADR